MKRFILRLFGIRLATQSDLDAAIARASVEFLAELGPRLAELKRVCDEREAAYIAEAARHNQERELLRTLVNVGIVKIKTRAELMLLLN